MRKLTALKLPSIVLTPAQLAAIVAGYLVVASNSGLFRSLMDRLDAATLSGASFLVTIVLLIFFLLVALILSLGHGAALKPFVGTLLITSSFFAYFSNNLGVVFDENMFLNAVETIRDRNVAEVQELGSFPLLRHVFLFGILPTLLLRFVDIRQRKFVRELGVRVAVLLVGAAILTSAILPNYRYISFFARENRDLRLKITPIYPLASLVALTRDQLRSTPQFQIIDAAALQRDRGEKRLVGIMVVGETARADRFSLGGYARNTNPQLQTLPGIVFAEADSCGTSTVFSVPCMFSMRKRTNYEPDLASFESNVLDILTAAGIETTWIENNSSCKGVCNRIETTNLRENPDPNSVYFSDFGYFDEVFLEHIDNYLGTDGPDTLIVLHTLGSHGPAYGRRYPERFGVFTPFCTEQSPTECTDEEVTNAYDNTIVYTDHVLSQLIDRLQSRSGEIDTFLFYASDHGESLGENGVYLHGLPYAIAPAAQKNVPFIFWSSDEFRRSQARESRSVANVEITRRSHDNISHTLLGLYDIDASSYDRQLDMLAASRPEVQSQRVSALSSTSGSN